MTEWKPSQRVGTPKVKLDEDIDGLVVVELLVSPRPPYQWEEHFDHWAVKNGVPVSIWGRSPDAASMRLETDEDSLERMIGEIDSAIESANKNYREIVLPVLQAEATRATARRDARAAKQRELDERAKGMAKPNPSERDS